jgi:hypothetical protein
MIKRPILQIRPHFFNFAFTTCHRFKLLDYNWKRTYAGKLKYTRCSGSINRMVIGSSRLPGYT